MLYTRFIFCLLIGLTGLCMVLKTLIDCLLADWDVVSELRYLFQGPFLRRHDYTYWTDASKKQEQSQLSTRLSSLSRS